MEEIGGKIDWTQIRRLLGYEEQDKEEINLVEYLNNRVISYCNDGKTQK